MTADALRDARGGERTICEVETTPARVGSVDGARTYSVLVGSQELQLPLVTLSDDLTIALLISVDLGIDFAGRAGEELAAMLGPARPEIVVSVATMGIPLAIEVTRALGLNDYVILHKTPKIHLADAIAEPVTSITTAVPQRLLFDRARMHAVAGRRVAVVDDVISTGASMKAALNLLRRVGAEPVAVGTLVTEGWAWRSVLGDDADLVRALGAIPLFRPAGDGTLIEEWTVTRDAEAEEGGSSPST